MATDVVFDINSTLIRKFKVSFTGQPDTMFKTDGEGDKFLHLRVPTLDTRPSVDLRIYDGEVVRTTDDLVAHTLENYRTPKVPIKKAPRGTTVLSHALHDDITTKELQIFTAVAVNTSVHHEI